jgi:hypothetical protein
MKQTKAEAEAYDLKRTHAMWAIDYATMRLCRPDLADLPYPQSDKKRPGRPYWFQRIVWDCQAAARIRAGVRPCLYIPDPEYDAASLESYPE